MSLKKKEKEEERDGNGRKRVKENKLMGRGEKRREGDEGDEGK
jgi:hypothetical protein